MTLNISSWPEDIFILIPSYKSAAPLKDHLSILLRNVPQKNVCVFDDGSSDGTDSVCKELGVDYVAHAQNMGKGASLIDGFRYVLDKYKPEWIITMDSDGQHAIEDLPAFLEYAAHASTPGMCIGVRSRSIKDMPFFRILSNTLTSWTLSLLCGRRIPDSQCGYRIYSAMLLKNVSCTYAHFEMESEIILKATRKNFPIGHVKIQTLYLNNKSHIAHIKDTLRWTKSVILVWLKSRKNN
jgi:glycosyltransferase involved in cell wall biosynthesis